MDYHALAIDMGWGAVLLGLAATLAQFQRARRLGVEGVSLATWVLFVFMGCFWISYGVAAHSWEVIMGSLLALPVQLAIVYRLQALEGAQGGLTRARLLHPELCAADHGVGMGRRSVRNRRGDDR